MFYLALIVIVFISIVITNKVCSV